MRVTPQQYGAVGDGQHDDTQAIATALGAATVVELPAGRYRITAPIVMPAGRTLVGEGSEESRIQPDVGVAGVIIREPRCRLDSLGVHYASTPLTWSPGLEARTDVQGYARVVPATLPAGAPGWWIWRCVQSGYTGATEPVWPALRDAEGALVYDGQAVWRAELATGILVQRSAVLRDVYVDRAPGSGVLISAFTAEGATGHDNANLSHLDRVRVTNSLAHGIAVDGSEGNACVGVLCDASSNRGHGFYDSGFLGNTWVACHAASNDGRPYVVDDPAAESTLLGCYAEVDQGPSQLSPRTVVLGGLFGAQEGGRWSRGVSDSWRTVSQYQGRGSLYLGNYALQGWAANGDRPLALDYVPLADSPAYGGHYVLRHGAQAALTALAFTGDATGDPGRAWLPRGVDVGTAPHRVRVRVVAGAHALPRAGAYGDVMINKHPHVDGVAQWHCVRTGDGTATTAGWRAVQLDGATVDGVA